MGKKDYLLIVVLYGSLVAGIALPESSARVCPYIKYLMMGMLFLAFIKISPGHVWAALIASPGSLALGTVLRLVLAPGAAFFLTRIFYEPLAFPMLLLAGVSTGVSSPFFTSLCRGNISFNLVMAVTTSLLVPFSLPFMVRLLTGTRLAYDLVSMALFLSMIILIPLAAAFAFRAVAPGMMDRLNRRSYPISLLVIALINFGALGRYLPYLKANPEQIVFSAVFSTALALFMAWLGWAASAGKAWPDRVSFSGSQVWLNNVLIIALAVHLDHSLAAALSVFYFIPLYGFVVFFSVLAGRADPGLETARSGEC